MTQRELDARRKRRNEDLIRLFLNGANVADLQNAYTLHENVVCNIIRNHLEKVTAELNDAREFNKRNSKKS